MQAFLAILQLLPLITQFVTAIEGMMPQAEGQAKKDTVLGALAPVIETVHQGSAVAGELVPLLGQTVDAVVKQLNQTNLWPRGASALGKIQAAIPEAQEVISTISDATSAQG